MEDMAKAAGERAKAVIDGVEYEFAPLTLGDLAAFQKHLKEQKRRDVRDFGDATPMERQELRKLVMREGISSEEMDREMATFEGALFLLWRSLRQADPKLTLEGVGKKFGVSETREAMDIINAISGMGDNVQEGEQSPPMETP